MSIDLDLIWGTLGYLDIQRLFAFTGKLDEEFGIGLVNFLMHLVFAVEL